MVIVSLNDFESLRKTACCARARTRAASLAPWSGWKVAQEEFSDGVTITGLKMTNTSEERQSPMLAFKFSKGSQVLGEVDCSAKSGETSGVDCYSLDQVALDSWDEIRVADRCCGER